MYGEGALVLDTTEPLTEDTDAPTEEMPTEEVDMKSMVEKLQYRIEELEKKIAKMDGGWGLCVGKGRKENEDIKKGVGESIEQHGMKKGGS